jgi:hypothetical protein
VIEKLIMRYMPKLYERLYLGEITQLEFLCHSESYGIGLLLADDARKNVTTAPVRVELVEDHEEFSDECEVVTRFTVDGGLLGTPFSFERGAVRVYSGTEEAVQC